MLKQALDTPWKISSELSRWLVYPSARLLFALNEIPWGQGWRLHGLPIIQKHGRSRMLFGPGLGLRSSRRSNPLVPHHPVVLCTLSPGALLQVGANFAMTGGVLCATERVFIGDNVAVGANTILADSDFHPLDPRERRLHPQAGRSAPICIEDDVFIGMNCLILKGVTIGRGSVIGAGSVVARPVPPGFVVAGNPARIIREIGG